MQSGLLVLHLLSMLGAFGVLLMTLWGLPIEQRRGKAGKRGVRLASIMLVVGLAAGVVLYVTKSRAGGLQGLAHMVIGIKTLLLFGSAACLGLASAKAKREQFRASYWLKTAAMSILVVATGLASTL